MDTNNHSGEVWFGSKKTAVMEYHQHHWGCRDKVSAPLLGGPLKKHPGEPNRATVIGTWGVSWHSKAREKKPIAMLLKKH
jgi:hypothetical protein